MKTTRLTIFASLLAAALVASAAETEPEKTPAAKTIEEITGKVLAIRADIGLVMLSIGSQQNVQPGFQFLVMKDGKVAGRIVVDTVYPDMAKARIVEGDNIQAGNDVVAYTSDARFDLGILSKRSFLLLLQSEMSRLQADSNGQRQNSALAKAPEAKEKLVEDETPKQGRETVASILAVRTDVGLVMISAGANKGIKFGQGLIVTAGGKDKCKIRIDHVYPDMASAKIIASEGKENPEVGDKVMRIKE